MAKKSRNRTTASPAATAVLEPEPKPEPQPVADSPQSSKPADDRYWTIATAVLLVAIILRQWHLGNAAYHPDEAIHAHFSLGFASYKYDPVYHGPLLYHLVSTTFGIFGALAQLFGAKATDGNLIALGATDYSARLVPSLCGIALVWLVLGPMRQFLGQRGALLSAALITLSPAIVTYSRRLLHDSLVLLLTLSAIACFLTTLEEPSNTPRGRNARLGLIIALTLFLATKANVFFIIVMLAAFWVMWKNCGRFVFYADAIRWLPPLVWIVVSGAAILWPRANNSPVATQTLEHILFQLVAASGCGWMGLWVLLRQPTDAEKESRKFSIFRFDVLTYVLCLGAALWTFCFLYGNGAQLMSALIQNHGHIPGDQLAAGRDSAQTAIKRMLEYWGGQQKKPRLPGRHDYYIVLMILYDLPILIAGIGGVWHACRNRSTLTDLLMWWAFTSWTLYAVANEKVPWLSVHILLPLALLGGIWLGKVVKWRQPAWALAGAAAAIFSLRGVIGTSFERAGDNAEPIFYAQTPEAYHDAINRALSLTQPTGGIWMTNERQWPTVWYLRKDAPGMGTSHYDFSNDPKGTDYRFIIGHEREWNSYYAPKHWQMVTAAPINFLIWPRASWDGLRPDRFAKWWLTRDTVPASERKISQLDWKQSILSGRGEWSNATTVVAVPPDVVVTQE